jgi:hypothetical protein
MVELRGPWRVKAITLQRLLLALAGLVRAAGAYLRQAENARFAPDPSGNLPFAPVRAG